MHTSTQARTDALTHPLTHSRMHARTHARRYQRALRDRSGVDEDVAAGTNCAASESLANIFIVASMLPS